MLEIEVMEILGLGLLQGVLLSLVELKIHEGVWANVSRFTCWCGVVEMVTGSAGICGGVKPRMYSIGGSW